MVSYRLRERAGSDSGSYFKRGTYLCMGKRLTDGFKYEGAHCCKN